MKLPGERNRHAQFPAGAKQARQVLCHEKRLPTVFRHAETEDRAESHAAELPVNLLQARGQVEHHS